MTYVDDAIGMVRAVMEMAQARFTPINIGNEDELSVEEIARAVARVSGIPFDPVYLPPREADPQRRRPDMTMARALGLSATTSLDDGLRATYEWLRKGRLAFA
jgi:nucleoside-diphosphate-sugar epimerase